jgi:hypothetical protein
MRGLLRLHHKKKEEKIFIDLIRTVKKQITRTNNLLINLISQRLLVQSWFAMKPLSNDELKYRTKLINGRVLRRIRHGL